MELIYANTYAPYISGGEKLWVRAVGEAPENDSWLFAEPGEAEYVRLIAPSGAEPGEPFEILVVSLDKFDNPSGTTFRDEEISVQGGAVVSAGLTFTGGKRIPVSIGSEAFFVLRWVLVYFNSSVSLHLSRGVIFLAERGAFFLAL